MADRVKQFFQPKGRRPLQMAGERLAVSLLHGNWTYFPSLCWRTDAMRRHGFRLDQRIVLDLSLQLALIVDGASLIVDDEVVFLYRRHDSVSSWSGSGAARFFEERALFEEFAATAARLGWKRAARAARLHLTSRLNALAQLPAALVTRRGLREVISHALRP